MDSFYQYSAVLNYEVSTISLFAGGELLTTTDEFQTAGTASATNSLGIRIGADAANNNLRGFYTGDVAELIVYNRALDNEERESIEEYLRQKWFEEPPTKISMHHDKIPRVNVSVLGQGIRITLENMVDPSTELNIYDLSGRVAASTSLSGGATGESVFEKEFLESGIYIYTLKPAQNIQGKFIIP